MLQRFSVNSPAPELGADLGEAPGGSITMGPSAPSTDWTSIFSTAASSIADLAKVGTSIYATRQGTIDQQRQADAAANLARLQQQRDAALMSPGGNSMMLPALLIGGGVLLLVGIYVLKKK